MSSKMKSLEALADIYCSEELTQRLHQQIICLSVINTLLAISAIAGNIAILIALPKAISLHRPSKALLRNLVVSDLCVGFAELVLVGKWICMLQKRSQICRFFFVAHNMGSFTLISVSLWILTAISVDRLLALMLGLRYRQVVTLRRVYAFTAAVWVQKGVGYPILAMLDIDAAQIVAVSSITVCLVTSTFCYTRIYFKLRNQKIHVKNKPPEQKNNKILLNISRYRKTVGTSLSLQLALLLCFLPYLLLAQFAYGQIEKTQSLAFYLPLYSTVTLMFFNSSLNPILYCWKNKEVRRAVEDTLRCRRM